MSRFRLTVCIVSLFFVGCLVAAFVQAQDGAGLWSAAKGARGEGRSRNQPVVEQYRSAGHDVAAAYATSEQSAARDQGAVALTAHQAEQASGGDTATGALRSVLKRNAPAASTTPPAPRSSPTDVDTASPAAPSSPAGPPAASRIDSEPASAPPVAAPRAETRDADAPPEHHASSRRTQRAPSLGASPPNVASKPIPTQRVDSVQAAGGPASGAAQSPMTLAKSGSPALRVELVGPATTSVGEEAIFKIQLQNQGEAEAVGAVVRIALPAGVQVVSAQAATGDARPQQDGSSGTIVWNLERLQAQAASMLTLTLVPTTIQPIEMNVDWSVQPSRVVARIDVKQPMLELALNGPTEMVYGDTKVFSIVLANPGTGDAKNVDVSVMLDSSTSDTLHVGTIAAGTSKSLDFEVTARQTGGTQIVATASGNGNLKQQVMHRIAVQRAELQVDASGPQMEFAGAVASYGVRVANTGNATARNVQLVVRVPQGARYLQGVGNVRHENGETIWQLGDLPPATERVIGFDCEMTMDGELTFQVAARGDGGLETGDELTTRVEALADLKLSVNDPQGPIPVGQEVVYEINVVNRGTKAATQVQVIGQFSEGIEPLGTDGMPGEIQTGQVVFQPIARINPKETVKLRVKAKALTAGNHVFRAAVQSTDPETRLVAEENTLFYGDGATATGQTPATSASADHNAQTPSVGQRSVADSVYRR